jgi:hypothetical protein
MAEPHVIGALRNKRAELAGIVLSLEQQLVQRRASLTHLDATMRLFDPEFRPEEIRLRQQRTCNAWFRPGECLRLIYDVRRDAADPVRTPDLVARIIAMKGIVASGARQRALIQKTILASLSRAKETIERIEIAGVTGWRVRQAALARCQSPQKSTDGRQFIARPTMPCSCSPLLTRRASSRQAASWA